jgi:type I restriction enzyme R subunit
MPQPSEHKSVQARILKYAQEIGWTFIPRTESEERRYFDKKGATSRDRARNASLFYTGLLFEKVLEFNPKYTEEKGELIKRFNLLRTDIFGNRDFLKYLREEQKFYCKAESRELDLKLIDYDVISNNVYAVTEEFYYNNGHFGNREDVIFLINGIPVLVIECKNATKDEAIALGIDQVRRYHNETPEMFVPQQIFTATESIGFSYGVTWNTIRRNIFNWKDKEIGNLEAKIKTFCSIDNVLGFLEHYIMFAEKDEELNKYILHQHQRIAVERVVERAHHKSKKRGLVWHTQGSGKTFTMIKTAEILFKALESDKPTNSPDD